MNTIISTTEVRSLGRPIGKHVNEEKLLSYIYEVEQLTIKKILGDAFFKKILDEDLDSAKLAILLDGGEYTDCDDNVHTLSGLKMAEAYFVYAQYVMDGDFQLTRSGVVLKDTAYSQHVSSKERSDCYNNALAAANGFLDEVLSYVRTAFSQEVSKKAANTLHKSVVIRKIG